MTLREDRGRLRSAPPRTRLSGEPGELRGAQSRRGEDGASVGRRSVVGRCEVALRAGGYSLRNDSIGFTPLARRAGTQLASAPMPSIISDIPANTSGSTACTS